MGAELEDMVLSWCHLYLTYNEKCVDSPVSDPFNMKSSAVLCANNGLLKEEIQMNVVLCWKLCRTGLSRPVNALI